MWIICWDQVTPFLGASPDGIIEYTDDGKKMKGVLEIKCTTGHLKLKHNHKYYQVQGQLALTGLEWCDFVIWNLGGISVERIYFDEDHCENLK